MALPLHVLHKVGEVAAVHPHDDVHLELDEAESSIYRHFEGEVNSLKKAECNSGPRKCKNLVAVVRPGPKSQVALLAVKGEVGDVHHAGAFGDGGGVPCDLAVVAQFDIRVHRPGEVVVGSAANPGDTEGRRSRGFHCNPLHMH